MAKNGSIMDDLWLVFSYYSIRDTLGNAEHLSRSQLVRFCEDSGIIMSKHKKKLNARDVEVACSGLRRSQINRMQKTKREGMWRGLSFPEFADILVILAEKLYYPEETTIAYERLLLEIVLPNAKKRTVEPISDTIMQEIASLFTFLKPELYDLFVHYYASPKNSMDWSKFFCFCRELGLVTTGGLITANEAADVFLCAASTPKDLGPDTAGRSLDFASFWEALVRCALFKFSPPGLQQVASRNYSDRVKAFFLALFRQHVQISTDAAEQMNTPKNLRSDRLFKIRKFKARFKLLWQQDGFPDYLRPKPNTPDSQAATHLIDSLLHPTPSNQTPLLLLSQPHKNGDNHLALLEGTADEAIIDGDDDPDPPPVEIERDTEDIGDARFSVDDLELLISRKPAIAYMLLKLTLLDGV